MYLSQIFTHFVFRGITAKAKLRLLCLLNDSCAPIHMCIAAQLSLLKHITNIQIIYYTFGPGNGEYTGKGNS